jgi:hypothetical protein
LYRAVKSSSEEAQGVAELKSGGVKETRGAMKDKNHNHAGVRRERKWMFYVG